MNPFKACAIAFSRFSSIPMPQFEWNERDIKYSMLFFPGVGAVTGMVCFFVYKTALFIAIPAEALCLIAAVLPVWITGGIHLDGYMDVRDALCSYKSREEKLNILKDPHIGAFAVINLIKIYLMIIAAFFILISADSPKGYCVFCCSFVLARALSVIGLLCMRMAKNEGTLHNSYVEAESVKKIIIAGAGAWMVPCVIIMLYTDLISGCLSVTAAFCAFINYYRMSMKNFGGITGDLAGYFVVICETAMALAAAAATVLQRY